MKFVYRLFMLLGATITLILSFIWFTKETGFWSWASSFSAVWFITAWFSTLHLLKPLRLTERYYKTGNFEKSGRIYELLGVPFFLKLVRRGPFHILAPEFEYTGKRELLPVLMEKARSAETIHIYVFITLLLLTAYAFYNGWFWSAIWILVYNIPLNVYPIMLQRYNRMRFKKVIEFKDTPGCVPPKNGEQ